jgi:dCTP deaminase
MSPLPMSVLSDGTIVELVEGGKIRIDPWDPELVQPASVDLRLGDSFRVFHNHRASAIDLRNPPAGLTEEVVVPPEDSFVIHPGEFCLGRTLEWVELPDDIVARIEGKSSLGRLGLIVHATAGFCDPGWRGTLTLELNNLTRIPIKLYPGLPIAQLSFMALRARKPLPGPALGYRKQISGGAGQDLKGLRPCSRRSSPPPILRRSRFSSRAACSWSGRSCSRRSASAIRASPAAPAGSAA